MRSSLVRSLALACGLLLALPPGWCCLLALPASTPRAEREAPKPRPCCGHCQQAGKPAGPSAPTKRPLPPGKCPCTDRDATSPDALKTFCGDLSLTAPLAVGDLVPSWTGSVRLIGLPVNPSDNSLQPLLCVWLC